MIGRLTGWMQAIGPVRTAILCSLLLSAVAVWNSPVLNRDGMVYVLWAREIRGHGVEGSGQYGLLLALLPAMISVVSATTGLSHETAAHLLNAVLLAGACGLMVAMVRRRQPEAAWVACLVVLAMPGYNGYRNDVLREYGLWFFGLLALWLAMRWEETGRWREALACQVALFVAALFRIEALAYFPALMLWQFLAAPAGVRLRRVLLIGCLPLAGAAVAGLLFVSGMMEVPHRLAHLSQAFNPLAKVQAFNEMAGRMSDLLFGHKYTREEAGYVLFFGLLTIILVKFLKMSGLLIVPMIFAFSGRSLKAVLARWQPLPWIFLAHTLALAAYVTYQYFLQGRYAAMLNLLAVPVVAVGLFALMQRFPRWRWLMLALALMTLLANVVSLSPKSMQIVEAGKWLAGSRVEAARIYVDNPRVAYYAGLRYAGREHLGREELAKALADKRFDLLVLDAPAKDRAGLDAWMVDNRLQAVRTFANKAGNTVVVAVPAGAQPGPEMTERSRSNTGPIE
jgi:hypothetical protein